MLWSLTHRRGDNRDCFRYGHEPADPPPSRPTLAWRVCIAGLALPIGTIGCLLVVATSATAWFGVGILLMAVAGSLLMEAVLRETHPHPREDDA